MSATMFDFQIERAKRRPYAGLGDASLDLLAKKALEGNDNRTLELIVKEVKRRRVAPELAK